MTRLDVPPITEPHAQLAERSPVNFRSITLGIVGIVLICGLTPYNDWVVNNTYLIGNYMPVGLLLFFLSFIILINGPLRRFAPARAFSSGELAVALAMTLVSCAVASSGLIRYLPATLIGVQYQAGVDGESLRVLRELNLPNWIFPTIDSDDPLVRANDPVVQNYWLRTPGPDDTFAQRFAKVPWSAWITPALTWGILIAAFWGAILCTAVIVRRQWVENERLPFPIAQIYLSLIEAPESGRALNRLFRSRAFWAGFLVVFTIHFFNAMARYDPQHWPLIPIEYDFRNILTHSFWMFVEDDVKMNTLFFSIVGITFFLQTKVAFSLWFFYLALQAMRVIYGQMQGTVTAGMQQDHQVGAIIPYALAIVWVGRQHWNLVLRQMCRGTRADDPSGKYLPHAVAGWGLLACLAIMGVWLVLAGTTVIGAVVLISLIMLISVVVARVVAETGLMFVQLGFPYWRPWAVLLSDFGIRTSNRTFFYHGFFSVVIGHDVRENLSVFSTHAMRVADDAAYPPTQTRRRTGSFVATLVLALAVAYLVSGASMLFVEYNHAVSLDPQQTAPINPWATDAGPKVYAIQPTARYIPPGVMPPEAHSRAGHLGLGFGLMTILSVLRLRYEWWPLHPVGILTAYGWPMQRIWFSIMVGWLLKVLIVRFGGMDLFRIARNLFIGLIIGEATAAAFWLVVSLVRNSMGLSYEAIRLLPA